MKNKNSIWELTDSNGNKVWEFSDVGKLRVSHFKEIFKEPVQTNIEEMLKTTSLFLRSIEGEDNEALYRLVSKEELLAVINSFKKAKSPGLDG